MPLWQIEGFRQEEWHEQKWGEKGLCSLCGIRSTGSSWRQSWKNKLRTNPERMWWIGFNFILWVIVIHWKILRLGPTKWTIRFGLERCLWQEQEEWKKENNKVRMRVSSYNSLLGNEKCLKEKNRNRNWEARMAEIDLFRWQPIRRAGRGRKIYWDMETNLPNLKWNK